VESSRSSAIRWLLDSDPAIRWQVLSDLTHASAVLSVLRSTRSSFDTTICVLEALLEYELQFGSSPQITDARLRGQEYLLERHLFHSKTTGKVIEHDRKDGSGDSDHPAFTRFAFPTWWHYDVLRGLEYLRHAGITPDERLADAIQLVESKRNPDGRWLLEIQYPGNMPVKLDEGEGLSSKWNTLRALRVLKWYWNSPEKVES
jgi:hypothetical protein